MVCCPNSIKKRSLCTVQKINNITYQGLGFWGHIFRVLGFRFWDWVIVVQIFFHCVRKKVTITITVLFMSIVWRERYLWTTFGASTAALLFIQQERILWRSTDLISEALTQSNAKKKKERFEKPFRLSESESNNKVFGERVKSRAREYWNDSIDFTFKPIVDYLSKKGY